jgi:hypothetical protein
MVALCFARTTMDTPAKNLVEVVDLLPSDALLPILECVSNSIISLSQSDLTLEQREIDVEIVRGEPRQDTLFLTTKPIKDVIVTDNGIGFNEMNFASFKTPYSNALRQDFGCLGVGRFSVLAAFRGMKIRSNFRVNGHWKYREFNFDTVNEVKPIVYEDSSEKTHRTVVEMLDLYNDVLLDKTAVPLEDIANQIMKHFFIFYLSNNLPKITLHESDCEPLNVNDLFKDVSKGSERHFEILDETFKLYITRNPKTTNRRTHYYHYCADSRVVGRGKRLSNLDSIFSYPLIDEHTESFLDVFVVSTYLDERKYTTRNGFRIPSTQEERSYENEITLQDIGQQAAGILRDKYSEHVKKTQQQNIIEWQGYMAASPRFNSLLKDEEVLRNLPANTPDDKKEEYLHRIIYSRLKKVDEIIQEFIDAKKIDEESIQEVVKVIQHKAVLDSDKLADYMIRRRAIIDLFEKFLEADKKGDYKLEADIHNLIFPKGYTSENTPYEGHNLWLLDERFVSYKFIASHKPMRGYSNVASRKAADIAMFDNPIGLGDKESGDISSLVIFEFKRPGDVASTPSGHRWEFSKLTDKYFDEFRYGETKHKGRHVNVRPTTPKFGFIILSHIPEALENYNLERGWRRTPFGSFYRTTPESNMHLEAMTFDDLIAAARLRHNPFFDKLFLTRYP